MQRRGIAMVEAILATAIVGGVAVAAMSLVGSVAVERRVSAERSMGQLLVRQLAEEIASLPTDESLVSVDTGGGTGFSFGNPFGGGGATAEATAEVSATDRLLHDEIIDYDDHSNSPPESRDGTPVPGTTGWTRRVEITQVALSDPQGTEVADTGVYRVRVTAEINGRVAGEFVFYRTAAGDRATR